MHSPKWSVCLGQITINTEKEGVYDRNESHDEMK